MTTLYTHPDGYSIKYTDNALTVDDHYGKSVSIPIGTYGLLLLADKLESVASAHQTKGPPTKCNGPDAPHDRPAKTLTKHTADFIARAARYATVNSGFNIIFLVLALQFVLIVWGAR